MTPLRQALSEADKALTGTLLAKMQDVEAARATVRLKKAAQDLLAALDASATTGRETPHIYEPRTNTLIERLADAMVAKWRVSAENHEDKIADVWEIVRYFEDSQKWPRPSFVPASILPSPPPAAPPDKPAGSTTAPFYNIGGVDTQPPAPRRAETPAVELLPAIPGRRHVWGANGPTLRPNRFDCTECGPGVGVDEDGCCRTCGQDATIIYAVPSPAPPEGPRDAAPPQATCEWTEDSGGYWTTTCGKLFTQGSHYRFCPYCGKRLIQVAYVEPVEPNDATGATP